jgi:hypothetical protein
MKPKMEISLDNTKPASQGMLGSEFLPKINHWNFRWDSTLLVLNQLRVDVQRAMWDKTRPSYMKPAEKSFSEGVLKYIAQLRCNVKKEVKVEVDIMDPTRGEKKTVAIGHYFIFQQDKQKSHAPKPARCLLMYGRGVDNVDLMISLGTQAKAIETPGKLLRLGEWAPRVTGKDGKPGAPEFKTRRECRNYLVENKEVLKSLVKEIKETGIYLPTLSLLEIRQDFNPETNTLNEAQTHLLYRNQEKK